MRNGSFRAVATFSAPSKFLQHHIAREARTSSHRGAQAEGGGLEPDIKVSLSFEDSMTLLLLKVTRSWFWQQQWLAKLYRRQNRLQSWRKDTYIRFGILQVWSVEIIPLRYQKHIWGITYISMRHHIHIWGIRIIQMRYIESFLPIKGRKLPWPDWFERSWHSSRSRFHLFPIITPSFQDVWMFDPGDPKVLKIYNLFSMVKFWMQKNNRWRRDCI